MDQTTASAPNLADVPIAIAHSDQLIIRGAWVAPHSSSTRDPINTNDDAAAYNVARSIRTGTFVQNGPKFDFSTGFGGFKQSGLGREGGSGGIHHYLEMNSRLRRRASHRGAAPDRARHLTTRGPGQAAR